MRLRHFAKLSFILLGINGCSSVEVSSDYDQSSDFAALSSFNWVALGVTGSVDQAPNAIMDARIRNSISNQLTVQGFRSDENNSDFLVNYHVITQDKVDIDVYNTYGGYGPSWRWYGGYGYRGMPGYARVDTREYTQGTLIIDVIDPTTIQLIWRGMGSKKLPTSLDPDKADALVNEVVASILANFPPE